MCGISGFIGKGEREDAEKMNAALLHRGPDEQGVFFESGVGLGHTRLSILDLSPTGCQPMFSKDHLLVTVFNGEIYNFSELKNELQEKKHVFVGSSDTEVILALYEEYGEKCFEKMEGMFAIALYDRSNKKLLLARDRMGKKPLYWFFSHGTLVFASELKALLKHPLFKKEIDLFALNKYLAYEHIPTPESIFKGVRKLEPGSYLVFENGKTRKETFWNPCFVSESISFRDAILRLDEEINNAVKRRMIADVPIGVFLSGGLDSSAIAYYAQNNSEEKIKTFSIGFSEKSFDESSYAREVAKFLGTEHHEKTVTAGDLLAVIPEMAALVDEPLADASIIPTFLLSKFAKEHVTVALGGDGGDELFAGYPTFQADIAASLFPKAFMFPAEKMLSLLPISHANFSFDFKAWKFLEGVRENDSFRRHMVWLGAFNGAERAELFSKDSFKKISGADVFDDLDRYRLESKNATLKNALLYAYERSYLMDQVMTKTDRASMFASLETRAPFLDRNIVDFVNPLPFSYKMHGFTTKYILKKLMEGKLPKHIIYRKKKGFGLPVAKWLAEDLHDFCNDTLSESAIKKAGFFKYDYIAKLKSEHFEKRNNHAKKLWTLLVFQLWYNQYAG
ncbi:MAG: asparagine synthase (glutamine-hydrolyzing) [Candidatus Paceibacterota bacterium]|jgi:asparagine synthase (glutamine-hydrolysing)